MLIRALGESHYSNTPPGSTCLSNRTESEPNAGPVVCVAPKRFSEDVGEILCGREVAYYDLAIFYQVSNVVVSDVDVFNSDIPFGILCKRDCACVIVVKDGGSLLWIANLVH